MIIQTTEFARRRQQHNLNLYEPQAYWYIMPETSSLCELGFLCMRNFLTLCSYNTRYYTPSRYFLDSEPRNKTTNLVLWREVTKQFLAWFAFFACLPTRTVEIRTYSKRVTNLYPTCHYLIVLLVRSHGRCMQLHKVHMCVITTKF